MGTPARELPAFQTFSVDTVEENLCARERNKNMLNKGKQKPNNFTRTPLRIFSLMKYTKQISITNTASCHRNLGYADKSKL